MGLRRMLVAVGMVAAMSSPAWAWEVVDISYSTTVTRVLDVGSYNGRGSISLAEAPAAQCVAVAGRSALPAALYDESWIALPSPGPGGSSGISSTMLSVAMFARAQNLQVRVTFVLFNGECQVTDIRTCADAACGLPAAP